MYLKGGIELGAVEIVSIIIGIIVGLITIFSFFLKPVINLNTTLTQLNSSLTVIKSDLSSYNDKNSKSHRRLWEHEEEQDRIINEHEIKIRLLQKHTNMEVDDE